MWRLTSDLWLSVIGTRTWETMLALFTFWNLLCTCSWFAWFICQVIIKETTSQKKSNLKKKTLLSVPNRVWHSCNILWSQLRHTEWEYCPGVAGYLVTVIHRKLQVCVHFFTPCWSQKLAALLCQHKYHYHYHSHWKTKFGRQPEHDGILLGTVAPFRREMLDSNTQARWSMKANNNVCFKPFVVLQSFIRGRCKWWNGGCISENILNNVEIIRPALSEPLCSYWWTLCQAAFVWIQS